MGTGDNDDGEMSANIDIRGDNGFAEISTFIDNFIKMSTDDFYDRKISAHDKGHGECYADIDSSDKLGYDKIVRGSAMICLQKISQSLQMFHSHEYRNTLSLHLSEVLEEIGVNEDIIMERRRLNMLMENIQTVGYRSMGFNLSVYHLGSQSEGTTTLGLCSDADILHVFYGHNVIQDLSEWKKNKINLLMIQEKENVTPGYCYLQLLRRDKPLFETVIPIDPIVKEHFIKDSSGRILLKNTFLCDLYDNSERHGPSNAVRGEKGYSDIDIVYAMHCNSLPQSASNFLDRHGIGTWPTSEMIRFISNNGCCLVGASSKISTYPELEWRISTSLGERYLMFNLNITQLHCYVLMKIILKQFLTPQSPLSSYMCKTVLLHCIQNTGRNFWKKNNLFTCLTYCLLELQSYIKNENCPHFIIPENNLMAGQFTAEEVKLDILRRISYIIQSDGYKTYHGHLQRHQDQQQALDNLIKTTMHDTNLGHKETALNLLAQCLEQENRPIKALWMYVRSLTQRRRKQRRKASSYTI
ncbi:uncharacterized protein LOC132727350 [Ruditapes philippinarum]|uniref:uncharacterized protein LOC132727350 n=1 Tax=Ruditapes philippinarum TaxID=129788 RepID=UPI00295B1520|nr:uncharacterized protein LOC132727350 [Ruditapes philippinarum]